MQAFVTRRGCCLQGHTDAPRVIPLEVHKEEEEVEETERGREREVEKEREREDREGQREKKVCMYVRMYVSGIAISRAEADCERSKNFWISIYGYLKHTHEYSLLHRH